MRHISIDPPYHCTRCAWRGRHSEAVHNRLTGYSCPRCRGDIAPSTVAETNEPATTPSHATAEEAFAALLHLLAAVCVGHIRWQPGTYGEQEARRCTKLARDVLLRSPYRVQARELRGPKPAAEESEAAP